MDAALIAGQGVDKLAERFGLSRSSLYRHKRSHLTAGAVLAAIQSPGDERTGLVDVHGALARLLARQQQMLATTPPSKTPQQLAIGREVRATAEAIAKLQSDERLVRGMGADLVRKEAREQLVTAMGQLVDALGLPPALDVVGLLAILLRAAEVGAEPDLSEWRAGKAAFDAEVRDREDREVARRVAAALAAKGRELPGAPLEGELLDAEAL